MKVAYIGNFKHTHCTEVHLARTFELLGHEVQRFQEDRHDLAAWEAPLSECDLVVYTRTEPGLPPAANLLWHRLKRRGVTTCSIHLDLFYGLSREPVVTNKDPLFRTEYVFTADGGHELEFERDGVNHRWLRPGVFAPECQRGRERGRYRSKVGFVGTADGYHPEWPWRRWLVEWLSATYRDQFVRLGPGSEVVRNQDLNDAYASMRVVVGDSLLIGPRYWSDRVYETVGRGGLLLHPHVPELAEEFPEGVGPVWFELGNLLELHELIELWADPSHDQVRQERIDAGVQFVRDNCSYTQRLSEALDVMGLT